MFTTKTQAASKSLTPEEFTSQPGVQAIMNDLNEHFLKKKKVVSDIVDKEGNQYVHLVQEGGGVLGVALVGYTYVLEEMGIRFMRLAGTSAGAINTMMLACIGTKSEKKWYRVLQYISQKNLFDFVDGHPFAQRIIKLFITNKSVLQQSVARIKGVFIALAVLLAVDIISLGLQHKIGWFSFVARVSFVLTGVLVLLCGGIVGYGGYMFKRFKKHGLGINPGKNFHDWMKDIMEKNGVSSITDLTKKAGSAPDGLYNRVDPEDTEGLKADVTLITSDIISENKVEFPKMSNLYTSVFTSPDCKIHPADFVRASMSIPVFFESYYIKDINRDDETIVGGWKDHFSVAQTGIPAMARFVDGGIMSNFPISIFYDPNRAITRMPTFGIRLDDVDHQKKKPIEELSLGSYFGKVFNTVRFFYDKDFLRRNSVYDRGVQDIDVHEFNWLNFGLTNDDQKKLFLQGVIAAKQFLIGGDNQSGFDWEAYKQARKELHSEEKKQIAQVASSQKN